MAENPKIQESQNQLVLSFLSVRRALGGLGFFLPLSILIWSVLSGEGLLASISDYFYSPMQQIFVGTLCAIAVFFWNYEGYKPRDTEIISDWAVSRVAAVGALLVAFSPMSPARSDAMQRLSEAERTIPFPALFQRILGQDLAQILHFFGAAIFFGALAVYCLVLFVRSDKKPDPIKIRENRIYRICGWIIVACMALIASSIWLDLGAILGTAAVYWLESIACFAFAISWLVKGKALAIMGRQAPAHAERAAENAESRGGGR